MGDVRQWISVKIQRALGFESVNDVADIVSSIMAKSDAKDIESNLRDFLGSDDTAEEIISGYFKKIGIPRAVAQPQKPELSVYTEAAKAAGRFIPREGVFEPLKQEEDDLGYGALAKAKKKSGKSGNRDRYQRVEMGQKSGGITVMKKVKKGARGDGAQVDSLPEFRERAICGCQARLHPFVNNCLRCGRIVCAQEDVGPCFFCGHFVTPQGTPQVPPFTARPTDTETPTDTPTPGNDEETPGNPVTPQDEAFTAGLRKAQENLTRLLNFDRTMAERTTVYDDQSDYFDMSNRWISAEERKRLAEKEAALIKSKQSAASTLVLDFAGRTVVTSVQSSDESHQRFKDQLMAEMQTEHQQQKIMDREEAEEKQLEELERIKAHIRHRADGSIFVMPGLDVPAPEFVTRSKDARSASEKASSSKKGTGTSSNSQTSPTMSLTSSTSIPIQPTSRLQTDFFPEVEVEPIADEPSPGHLSGLNGEEAASIKVRGIVEGFSGRTWTTDDRLEMISWMKEQGGNFYMWAPFDDPMHRRLWNHLFSDEEVANMKETISKCAQMGVEFNLALRPHSVDFRSILHTDALARKVLQAYEQCGCRSFSIIFADEERNVPSGCRSLSVAQSDLVNTLIQVIYEFVKLKNDGQKDKDGKEKSDTPAIRWLFCPSMNSATLETGQQIATLNYLRELNRQLDPRVGLLWSGPESPAASLDVAHIARCRSFFGKDRSLFFWDRLPQASPPYDLPTHSADAFDYALCNNQFIEAYDHRSRQLGSVFAGALVSTMAAPIPSRIMISTALQFFSDSKSYDPKKALLPALQKHVLGEKSEALLTALTSILSILPCSPMTKKTRAPAFLNRGDAEERGFFNGLKASLAKLDSASNAFPSKSQFAPSFALVRELTSMNLAYYEYLKDPKNATLATAAIRALRNSLIPVLYTEYDLTHYRALLFAHPIADKSLKGDVQRTYTKFKAANSISPKDTETKELCLRLATEATTSLRELESYLIVDYVRDDINAWRIFLNNLFFRDASKSFLHKIPTITTPPAANPNAKILEQRSARIKAKLVEEEKYRTVALKFKIASGTVEPEELPDNPSSSKSGAASSSAVPSSSNPTFAASYVPAKKVFRQEVKDLPVPGMRYIRDFLSVDAESKLIQEIEAKDWDSDISRRIQQYGFKFQYRVAEEKEWNTPRLEAAPALPQFLKDLGDELMNGKFVPNKPDQVIINEYTPGQGIRHHIDNPLSFEDGIVSISLGSPVVMEFANDQTGEKVSWLLEPRSLLILTKESRSVWSHAIARRTEDIWNGITIPRERRISVTMRKVKASVARAIFDAMKKK